MAACEHPDAEYEAADWSVGIGESWYCPDCDQDVTEEMQTRMLDMRDDYYADLAEERRLEERYGA